MSLDGGARATRRLLWGASLLLLPLPMLQFDAFVPVARYALLAGVTLGLIAAEGGGEVPYLFLLLMGGHAVVYAGLLWLASGLAARALSRVAGGAALPIAAVAAGLGLALALLTTPYVTPYSDVSLHSNLVAVLR